MKSNKGLIWGQYPIMVLILSNCLLVSYPNKFIEPESNIISLVIALKVVVFPEPLNPNNPNFSLGSRPK